MKKNTFKIKIKKLNIIIKNLAIGASLALKN